MCWPLVDAFHRYALLSIGSILQSKGAFERAREQYIGALDIRKRIYGETTDQPSIAECYEKIGNLHFENGNYEEAQKE